VTSTLRKIDISGKVMPGVRWLVKTEESYTQQFLFTDLINRKSSVISMGFAPDEF